MFIFSNKNDIFNKQINFINNIEGIDFSVLNVSSEVNNSVNNFKLNKKNIGFCQDCNNSDSIEEDNIHGFLICKLCGQVLEQLLDYNPEWKNYDEGDNNNARCGGSINPLLPSSSVGTAISTGFNHRMKMIQCWNSMQYRERSLNKEFKKIAEVCQKFNILKCVEDDAKIMYKMVNDSKHEDGKNKGKFIITRGKNRIGISAGCLYIACVKKGITHTPKEISDMYDIDYSEVNKGIKNVRKLINNTMQIKNNISHPSQFIKRYCNNLKILSCFTDEAIKVALNVEKLNIGTEHNPYSIAAACILMIAEKNKLKQITKKKLAAEFEISDVTINKTFKKIEVYKNIIFDKQKTELYSKNNIQEIDDDNEIPEIIIQKMIKFGIDPEFIKLKQK